MLKPVDSQASSPTQINVVLNWFEELKQKVPTGKQSCPPLPKELARSSRASSDYSR